MSEFGDPYNFPPIRLETVTVLNRIDHPCRIHPLDTADAIDHAPFDPDTWCDWLWRRHTYVLTH